MTCQYDDTRRRQGWLRSAPLRGISAIGRAWPDRGRPDSPEAWLVTVARNAHRDRARRAAREDLHGEPLEVLAQIERWLAKLEASRQT
ncbi:MAG: hypothetical protein GEV06_26665 [Luteitalea sp.]|nr:hypothetical protein [Luteitalea sp.]